MLLLSGGVGSTPLMSMARWLCDTHSATDTVFVHSARTPGDIVYHRELRNMAACNPAFQLHTFTRAATELYLTQSAVSKQIKRLEESLGTPLFERRGNEVSLTGNGAVRAPIPCELHLQ